MLKSVISLIKRGQTCLITNRHIPKDILYKDAIIEQEEIDKKVPPVQLLHQNYLFGLFYSRRYWLQKK